MRDSGLETIAIDLTPVLPGGENGGAKRFALEIVRRLSAQQPATRFVLLTQAASHEELASLDGPNVTRFQAVGAAASGARNRVFGAAARLVRHAPAAVKRVAARVGYRLHRQLKRGAASPVRDLGASLLFCPFTAPTYAVPGVPVVCTIYDQQYRAYPQFFAVEDVIQRERAFRDACERASVLAAISDFSRDEAIAAGGLDPARISTIPLRMGLPDAAPGGEGALGRWGLEPGRYLLYPANFWKHKNHEMLLTAFGIACRREAGFGLKLVLTGAPSARGDWIARAAAAMGLADRVVLPGFVPEGDLAQLLARSAGLVFPSLYEGFGLPLIEAMAAGIPVACSDSTALGETAGEAALRFDPRIPESIAAAMLRLASDTALRESLVRGGRERASHYTDADRMARDYWSLFRTAAGAVA
ncbi:MAG: glycosyltransferase family 4 protein [Betaproteobacteria bacterium]|nr:glycosyltransferase family 4 protein [Betaproteobacteria bacterium]